MRVLAAQLNPIVGDLKGNATRIVNAIERGRKGGADLVLCPELALTGYPPEDLLLLPNFITAFERALDDIIPATAGIWAVVGLPRSNLQRTEKHLHNSLVILHDCAIVGFVDKTLLPTYDVFDESRYFESGSRTRVWDIAGERVAFTICEDLWQHSNLIQATQYRRDPVSELQTLAPTLLLNASASPYSHGKFRNRLHVCKSAAQSLQCPVVLCNQVGGNDSLLFDGYSLWMQPDGTWQRAKGFVEDDFWIDTKQPFFTTQELPDDFDLADLYAALVMGVHDYFTKQGLTKACLGLSGGIDSAVVACLAKEALGSANVLALNMPSRYSVSESARDAAVLATRLGIDYREIAIEKPLNSYTELLAPDFAGLPTGIAEENLQARIRGMLLMAYANKFGYIVLNTGNKSELAMGYSTLYGDMCGGLSVIGDLTKLQVYALARWINREEEIIPQHTLTRPPSAELRADQKDEDTLPPYALLDPIIQAYVEQHRAPDHIARELNRPLNLVEDIIKQIHLNEYKRRQAPPVLRVTEKAFTIGRHFPIVCRGY